MDVLSHVHFGKAVVQIIVTNSHKMYGSVNTKTCSIFEASEVDNIINDVVRIMGVDCDAYFENIITIG